MTSLLSPLAARDWARAHALSGEMPDRSVLAVDLRSGGEVPRDLAAALVGCPIPVVALAEQSDSCLPRPEVDCFVDDQRALATIVKHVEQAPIAAMSLIKLSRAIEQLDLFAALDMESVTYGCLQDGPEYKRWRAVYNSEPLPAFAGSPLKVARDGAILTVTLDRPELRNSITVEMRDALVEAFTVALYDESITKVILNGSGKCFSVGGELREFGQVPDAATGHWVRSLRLPGRWLARLGARSEAHVHGACIGAGVELPAFAARLIAAPGAYFQLPEIQFGLVPGAGGCVSVAKRIGRHRFNYMALSGRRINCETALGWGLVDEIRD